MESAIKHTITKLDLCEKDRLITPKHLQKEQQLALKDILSESYFHPADNDNGPYAVELRLEDGRLVVKIQDNSNKDVNTYILSLRPYKRIIGDYFMMIQSYETARRSANREKLEAIDMGRRGLHNEGAELLQARLKNKIEMDFDTARRFFTLICVLHKDHIRISR
jgi:uncharacterized protein (UPF0262 family)